MKIGFEYLTKIIALTCIVLGSCKNYEKVANKERPNIVWLVTEDNSKHFLELYDKDGAAMPAIENLAQNGILFNNAFSNAPVCSVARSTLISGCYAPRIGAQFHRKMKQVPMPDGLKMFPQYLREAGYYTTNKAKEDYNILKSGKVWDESSGKASYKNRKPGQPFFHVQNYAGTHEGQLHFSLETMKRKETTTLQHKTPLFPYFPNTPIFRYTNAFYRDLHTKIDSQIGKFIEQLEADDLMDNTIIFYYGDHGGVLPRSKGYVYESGLNVPMVVYIPEKWKHLFPLERGSKTDAFVQFIDFAPTVLKLAGLKVPKQMDGKPFLGENLTKKELNKSNTTFGYADRMDEKYDLVRSVRKGKYKYIRNYQPFNIDGLFNFYRYKMLAYKEWKELNDANKLNEIQQQFFHKKMPEALYDIENDPHEVYNLAKNTEHQMVLKDLRKTLQKQVKDMSDLGFYPESFFIENGLTNPVAYGKLHKEDISNLIDIADLSLMPFDQSKEKIQYALHSKKPWERYWALITCSSFGKDASTNFLKKIKEMAKNDKELLVRTRAVEYLGLHTPEVPNKLIIDIVKRAKSETEANLILNSVALLKTVNPNFNVKLPKSLFDPSWLDKEGDLVNRRVVFINEDKK